MIFLRILLVLGFIHCFYAGFSQKTALVFSGGSAKGLAHVGVLKALEENDIPIDCIVGTSMGGIVGGFYAAGFSPEEIEKIVLSESFIHWVNGDPISDYNYFYHKSDAYPDFLTIDLSLDSTLNLKLNSSIAKDAALNFALLEHLAAASEVYLGDFDKLFVPLRVVAADIFTQSEVVISKGVLSDALRSTQSAPLFYSPIRYENQYLFDGGIYNNFPVSVAKSSFSPEKIIGVNVSSKVFTTYPYETDDELVPDALLYLLLAKSDPSQLPDSNLYLSPNLSAYSAFDFDKAKALIDSGYNHTIRKMPEIKKQISRRIPREDVRLARAEFRKKMQRNVYGPIEIMGFTKSQDQYLRTVFSKDKPLDIRDMKEGYFQLATEAYFENIYPSSRYDSSSGKHIFRLTKRPQKNFKVDFGGMLATRDISNLFMGVNYYRFRKTLMHFYTNFQTGNFYKSIVSGVRVDFPKRFYFEPQISYDNWNYLATNDFLDEFSTTAIPTILKRLNRKVGFYAGIPIGQQFKGYGYVGYFNALDQYVNGSIFITNDKLDRLRLTGFKTSFVLSSNTLNRKQYASSGKAIKFCLSYTFASELFEPGSTSVLNGSRRENFQWPRIKASYEQYFGSGRYKPGVYAEAVVSGRFRVSNYYGTLINSPGFNPFQDSRIFILQRYRAFNFLAGGVKNVFKVKEKVEFRLEGYGFIPFESIREGVGQQFVSDPGLGKLTFAVGSSLVYHSPVGPIGLAMNYYQDKENPLSILLHIGYILYHDHSLE